MLASSRRSARPRAGHLSVQRLRGFVYSLAGRSRHLAAALGVATAVLGIAAPTPADAAGGGWAPPPPTLPPAPPGATCVTIQRGVAGNVFDTDVSPGYGSWAAGNYPGLWTGLSASNHWSLVEFDLSPIPAGAQIVLSTFSIYESWSDKPGTVRAHRITAEWDEQTTSYANFGGAASWDPAVIGTFDALGYGYRSIDLTTLTQAWYSGAVPAHGILIEEDPIPNHAHAYFSSESGTAGYRPRLDVCYVTGGPCAGKQQGDACDDGNACTTGETCEAGQCGGGQTVTCTAQDACHDAGICDPATGQCTNPLKLDGAACDDGNACTVMEYCLQGTCSSGTAVSCDDQSACTTDSCDPQSGCQHAAVVCNDNSLCTTDSCDPATGCVFAAITCNDGDACTTDSCDPATGCTTAPVSCSDGVECTADSCAGGNCQHIVACPPGQPCSTAFCNGPQGQDPQFAWLCQ